MRQHQEILRLVPRGRGLHEITHEVASVVGRARMQTGLCTVFVRHTSASLVIQENADPTARRDLEQWFLRAVPDGDPANHHTAEGPDDMPAHIRSALTSVSEQVPVVYGRLGVGTWQGIFLFEHRLRAGGREVIVHVVGE